MNPVVYVAPDTLIVVPTGAWRGDGELRMRVARVMHELSRHTLPDAIWLEGTALGERPRWLQALVRIDALPGAST